MDRFAQMILAAARQAEQDSGIDIAADAERDRRLDRDRDRRPAARSRTATTSCCDRGPDRVSPFSIPCDHPEHGRRLGLDRARHQGPADEPVHRLRRLEHGDRRRARRDPARPRRRDDRRRHARRRSRGSGSPASTRCARSRAATTIRSAPRGRSTTDRDGLVMGEAAGVRRARGARARAGARREDLRRAARLRDVGRRGAHDRARPDRPEPGARDDAWRSPTPASTRPRSATSTRTPPRRRSATAAETKVIKVALGEEHARRDPDLLDEGRDRATASAPPARSRRSSRSSRCATGSCRRRSTSRRPIPTATSTTSRTSPREVPELDDGALELVRLRRPQRDDRPAPLGRELEPAVTAARALGDVRLLRDADRLERRDPGRARAAVRRRRGRADELARALPRARARARARRDAHLPRGDDRGDAAARRARGRGGRPRRLAARAGSRSPRFATRSPRRASAAGSSRSSRTPTPT